MSDERESTVGGPWLIEHPRGLFATFFLPLPEPLGLPAGVPLPTYQWVDSQVVHLLKDSGEEFVLLNPDSGEARPERPDRDSDAAPTGEVEYWADTALLSTSIMCHQVQGDFAARSGYDAALEAASKATRPGFVTAPGALSTLTDTSTARHEYLAAVAEAGIGVVTVLEVAVPLRLSGPLPPLDVPVPLLDRDRMIAIMESATTPGYWPIGTAPDGDQLDADLVVERLHMSLAAAVYDVRALQRAYHAVTRLPKQLITAERLPIAVPLVVRSLQSVWDGAEEQGAFRGAMSVNENYWSTFAPPELSDEQVAHLQAARRRPEGHAFTAHLELRREADVALRRSGDTRLAGLLVGLAAESLVACHRDGTTSLPRAWDHLEVSVSIAGLGHVVNVDAPGGVVSLPVGGPFDDQGVRA